MNNDLMYEFSKVFNVLEKPKRVKKVQQVLPIISKPAVQKVVEPPRNPEAWVTKDGKKILYSELMDSHLIAILNNGYRNEFLVEEANSRKIAIPKRIVDNLDVNGLEHLDNFIRVGSEAGSKFCQHVEELRKTDIQSYLWTVDKILNTRF